MRSETIEEACSFDCWNIRKSTSGTVATHSSISCSEELRSGSEVDVKVCVLHPFSFAPRRRPSIDHGLSSQQSIGRRPARA